MIVKTLAKALTIKRSSLCARRRKATGHEALGTIIARRNRKMKKTIWTAVAHELLYQELVKQFGPARLWVTSARPGRNLDKKFVAFCESFAKLVGANSSRAVEQQIAYARMMSVSKNPDIMRQLVLNKAAALHAGFIRQRDMPTGPQYHGRTN